MYTVKYTYSITDRWGCQQHFSRVRRFSTSEAAFRFFDRLEAADAAGFIGTEDGVGELTGYWLPKKT